MVNQPRLTLIQGDRDRAERDFRQLLEAPQSFDEDAFDDLFERFRNRLTIEQKLDLHAKRLRLTPCASEIEKKAVLAAIAGDFAEADRLGKILDRRNARGLKVISSRPPAQPTPVRYP